MNNSLVRRSVLLLLTAGALWSCSGSAPMRSGGAKSVDAEFDRCREEEEHGEAKGCWSHFLDNFRNVASSAQVMVAEDHLKGTDRKAAEGSQKAADSAMTTAGSGAAEGAIVTSSKSNSAQPPPSTATATSSPRDCYRGIELSGNAQRDLDTVVGRCGRPTGLSPFSDVLGGDLDENGKKMDSWTITLRNDRCYRFFAVAAPTIEDLDAAILNEAGEIVAKDTFPDRAPILNPEDAYCPPTAGRYKYVLVAAKGRGDVKFQVWQRNR